ncbi:hypothetical protein K491DRAFT_732968 [Lophiostoma macrostomum CBS 122681]|uniref:F-box domain-containing protein n=1 Tax=Lophiostoma macrostomum CBS 122681 TaxID=1314788 RepID=A0A6A6SUI3_9PLEO|nr:hypothetical protein K491DRAFT_732968 [Lophiostoma macrostomum CBS 122681]
MTSHATFSGLAAELKLNVLEHLFSSGTDFTKALLVCKEWTDIGTPLLWANIALDNYNFIWFIRSISGARPSSLSEIRNMTIRLTPFTTRPEHPLSMSALALGFEDAEPRSFLSSSRRWPDYLFSSISSQDSTEASSYDVQPLRHHDPWYQCIILCTACLSSHFKSSMNGLRTFSFGLEPLSNDLSLRDYNRQDRLIFPTSTLALLIQALPVCCESLELDIDYLEPSLAPEIYLSTVLSQVIPQLRHLHLKVNRVLESFFDCLLNEVQPLVQLESLSLDISPLLTYGRSSFDGRADLNSQDGIVADIVKAYKNGQFPNALELVCSLVNERTYPSCPHGYMRRIDVINERIDAFSSSEFCIVPDRQDITRRWYTYEQDLDALKVIGLVSMEELGGPVYMDQYMRNRSANVAWITSTNGCRFPMSMRNSREVKEYKLNFVDPLAGAVSKVELLRRVNAIYGNAVGTAVFAQIQAQTASLKPPTRIEGLVERRNG